MREKKTTRRILVMGIVVLTGFCVYLVWENRQLSAALRQTNRMASEPTASGGPVGVSRDVDAPLDWVEYRGNGFRIGYPKGWILDRDALSQGIVWLRTAGRQADLDAEQTDRMFDVAVTVYADRSQLPDNDQAQLTFPEWIREKADAYGFTERTPVVIDGAPGYQGIGNGEVADDFLQFVEHDGKIYEIEVDGQPTEEEMKIVESFRFGL